MSDQRTDLKIDFLSETDHLPPKALAKLERPKRPGNWKKIIGAIFIVLVIAWAIFSTSIAFSNESLIKNLSKFKLLEQIGQLILSPDRQLQGEADDRINFLIMGIAGDDYDGGLLTDTIILASYQPSTKQAALMSIPRDLYVKDNGRGWLKINAISAYAEKNKPSSGGQALSDFLSKTLDWPIQYYTIIDFDGFEKLIDEFGGIDVVVANDLIDNEYPIRGREDAYPIESRYEKLVIKKGLQHFDGATALKYARSRHALGIEGSDFARSQRQQKIILALKEKILKLNTLFNPAKISALMKTYNEHINTNLQVWEAARLINLFKNFGSSQIAHLTLNDGPDNFLRSTIINGAYALLPIGGSYEKIKFAWKNIFNPEFSQTLLKNVPDVYDKSFDEIKDLEGKKPTTTATATPTGNLPASTTPITAVLYEEQPTTAQPTAETSQPTIANYKTEGAKIVILNGTNITGWAALEKSKLIAKGFKVIAFGNAPTKNYAKITLYDLTGGTSPLTIAELKKIYGNNLKTALPGDIKATGEILIILGK